MYFEENIINLTEDIDIFGTMRLGMIVYSPADVKSTIPGVITLYDYCMANNIRYVHSSSVKLFDTEKINSTDVKIRGFIDDIDPQRIVVIPPITSEGRVTTIEDFAFQDRTDIISVIIPEGIQHIGYYAFDGCVNLEEVYFESDLITIGENVFRDNAPNFRVFGLNSGVVHNYSVNNNISFNKGTAAYCFEYLETGINEVTITGLKNHYCNTGHKHITIPSVIYGRQVTAIAESAFETDDFISIIIPSTVQSIGDNAFRNCGKLLKVYFDSESVSLGADIFEGTPMSISVYAPVSNNDVTTYCTNNNINLISSTSASDLIYQETPEGLVIKGVSDTLTDGKLTIPSFINGIPVIGIDNFAFFGNTDLNHVTIGRICRIYRKSDNAFNGCTSLLYGPLPYGLKTIGIRAFSGASELIMMVIPVTVNSIGNYAFSNCVTLDFLRFEGEVAAMGANITAGCEKVNVYGPGGGNLEAYFGAGYNESTSEIITADIFKIIMNDSVTVEIVGLADYLGDKDISVLEIPAYINGRLVVSIAPYAFAGNVEIASVTLPDTIEEIGVKAFSECTNLTYINIPDNVRRVGSFAFALCGRLERIEIGKSMTELGNGVFDGCSNLINIEIDPDNPKFQYEDGALQDNTLSSGTLNREGEYLQFRQRNSSTPLRL